MKQALLKDPNNIPIGFINTKIPKHRRPKFEIESKEDRYKQLDAKRDQTQRLNFNPFGYNRKITSEEDIGHVRRTLRTSSKIAQRFKLYLEGNRVFGTKVFAQYSQEIKKMQGLRAFDFEMWGTGSLNGFALKNVGIGLKPLKHLRYLRIKINESYGFDDPGVISVGEALRGLVSLETLDLTFDEGATTDAGIKVLWSSFKHLKALETLKMSFHYCGGIEYADIGNVEKNFKGLKSLKEIKLNLFMAEMMDFQGIKKISSMFRVLTGLEKVDLCLFEVDMDNKGLKKLMEGFKGKSELKKITLNIGSTSVTNKGLDCLKECLKGLSKVEHVMIDLEGCEEITQKGKEKLEKGLKEIPSLKHLEVKFDLE